MSCVLCAVVLWDVGCAWLGLTVGAQVPHERFWQAQLDVGVGSAQGYRPYHEDEFQVVAFLSPGQTPEPQPAETHFFAVFDGHAGGRCSKVRRERWYSWG